MGGLSIEERNIYLPYDDINKIGKRKRRRGLTYLENTELQKYQNRKGIPAFKPQPKNYSHSHNYSKLGKPLGKPTQSPILPLPGQTNPPPRCPQTATSQLSKTHQFLQPSPNPYPAPYSLSQTSKMPPPPPGYPGQAHTQGYPSQTPPPPIPAHPSALNTSHKEKKKAKGMKRWFGFAKS